jgi:Domain of unknown function (DU1801)
MQSSAKTVKDYLASLPADRRAAIEAVRQTILDNLDPTYEEGMQYGMIGYYVPHAVYPPGYHCDPKQPLPFVCLASQKNYMSLYMGCVYGDHELARWFREAWAKTGKKLDMGVSCIRFKKLDDLPLPVIGEAIKRMPVKKLIEFYETCYETMRKSPPKRAAAKAAKAKTATKRPKTSAKKAKARA